jgi:hypothetical protein
VDWIVIEFDPGADVQVGFASQPLDLIENDAS